jgi:hypothetical protein
MMVGTMAPNPICVAVLCLLVVVATAPTSHAGAKTERRSEMRQGTQLTSPCDGWIVYAGEFRGRQLVIINAGGGYEVLITGPFKNNRPI